MFFFVDLGVGGVIDFGFVLGLVIRIYCYMLGWWMDFLVFFKILVFDGNFFVVG